MHLKDKKKKKTRRKTQFPQEVDWGISKCCIS